MSIQKPWRHDASREWWIRRDVMLQALDEGCSTPEVRTVNETLTILFGEQDQLHLCAAQLKKVKGTLNEHDFDERIRIHAEKNSDGLADIINLQNRRRIEYTRLRLLLQRLLERNIEAANKALASVRDVRSALVTMLTNRYEYRGYLKALGLFVEVSDHGQLFKKLEEYRILATEDATNGHGERELVNAALRLSTELHEIDDSDLETQISFDLQYLQLDYKRATIEEQAAFEPRTAGSVFELLSLEKQVTAWESAKEYNVIERTWQHPPKSDRLDEVISGLASSIEASQRALRQTPPDSTTAGVNPERLHACSLLMGAHHVLKCCHHLRSRIKSVREAWGNQPPSFDDVRDRLLRKFDQVTERTPEKIEGLNQTGKSK
jgi:hypothetical protein